MPRNEEDRQRNSKTPSHRGVLEKDTQNQLSHGQTLQQICLTITDGEELEDEDVKISEYVPPVMVQSWMMRRCEDQEVYGWYVNTARDDFTSFLWSRSVTWCLTEGYGNRDQRVL